MNEDFVGGSFSFSSPVRKSSHRSFVNEEHLVFEEYALHTNFSMISISLVVGSSNNSPKYPRASIFHRCHLNPEIISSIFFL